MITCYVHYELEPGKVAEFEHYAKLWIPLVEKFGGQHHGYFLPHESANDLALALFSFPSLAAYEQYRKDSMEDEDCQKAFAYAEETQCIRRYDRQFLRPVLK
ncbi:NIPSNAP family protein [Pseudovibrio denitrificans]|uniref:NIPSNAP family protein n=1 Tax=Pseudovibrio TaxID=258255 RepID=UPI000186B6BF|nr:NIPSNAP family protein [Pseudovibrio sp. JE062]EEA95160.1 nipsnap family containing protein [Pseudovibrio sp. JE062]